MARRTRRGSRLTRSRLARTITIIALLAGAVACRSSRSADDITSRWVLDPATPHVNATARIILELETAAGQPVRGATLQMAAQMSHPGMAAVVSDAIETVPGSYAVDIQLTMSGDWTIVASGTLADGRRITRSTDIKDVR